MKQLVETTLRLGSLGLVDIVEQADLPAGTQLLVVADQFEELFRFRALVRGAAPDGFGPREDAVAFVQLLLEAAAQTEVPIYVVLTMRSDFLGDCAQFHGLPEAINEGQYLVPRLTRDEIRAAITGPAAWAAPTLSPVLVTRLLNDVGDNPDQLSILQHALNRTWANWETDGEAQRPAGPARTTRLSAAWRMRWTGTPRRRTASSAMRPSADACAEQHLQGAHRHGHRSARHSPADQRLDTLGAITGASTRDSWRR